MSGGEQKRADGGPAFPSGESYTTTVRGGCRTQHSKAPFYRGMTLRDYFAAKAMQALILLPEERQEARRIVGQHNDIREEDPIAHWAYKYADAMLRERSK